MQVGKGPVVVAPPKGKLIWLGVKFGVHFFAYDSGGRGKGGTATLSVNGQKVAEGRIANTNANLFSAAEGADVGLDEDTPVTEAYQAGAGSRFTGKIDKVTVQVR